MAFANKPSKLNQLQIENEPVFLDFGSGEGFWFEEYSENLLAKDGYQITFEKAKTYFPYLIDKDFWPEEGYAGYGYTSYEDLIKLYEFR